MHAGQWQHHLLLSLLLCSRLSLRRAFRHELDHRTHYESHGVACRQIVLTPKGEYASALHSGVKAQYAGSVQPVPAVAANLAAFRRVAGLAIKPEPDVGTACNDPSHECSLRCRTH